MFHLLLLNSSTGICQDMAVYVSNFSVAIYTSEELE
jgi:hypothetical protein